MRTFWIKWLALSFALLGAPFSVTVDASLAPLTWTASRPLIFPVRDAQHPIVSVKDPTVVYHNGKWQVFATTADTSGAWSMVYLNFKSWEDATAAKPFYLDQTPGLSGYHCAPQVFYFRPQNKWYLIYQSQHPTYSTTDDIENPRSWTAPQAFFQGTPASVVQGWIDYWIICDEVYAYLFFSDDNGRFYRSRTPLADFPRGFSDPVVVMQDPNRFNLFEASCVYRLKGLDQYLCFIECLGPNGRRYFRAFTSTRLDGQWAPLAQADSWETPFAGANNVKAADGGTLWTADISHGELLREGNDETMTVDPAHLRFLFQGMDRNATAADYSQSPYRLALLEVNPAPVAPRSRLVNISTRAYCGIGDAVTIGGFVVQGDSNKRLLVRAVGPSLTTQGLSAGEVLADPSIEVHDALHGNVVIATNDNWADDANAASAKDLASAVGAAAFSGSDKTSSALVLTLPAGVYTFVVTGQRATAGIVLLEVYEVDTTSPTTLVNIASRAYTRTENNVAIGGFVITGAAPKQILMRAVGPTLENQGIRASDLLQNPQLELHDAAHGNVIIATNDDWRTNVNEQAISSVGARVGATPFAASDTKSAALLMTLPPGVYSFVCRGANDTSGISLVEIYDAD